MTSRGETRLRQLDVLRGVAVVLVLGRHMGAVPTDAPMTIQGVLDVWVHAGWIGVDLFFVLSGFLVSGLLFREYRRSGDVRVGRFVVRRALRIYPAFYAFLFSTSVLTGTVMTRQFVAEAAFVQNYVPGLWDHTWSLAIEEHFYLLLALLVVALVHRLPDATPVYSGDTGRVTDPFARLVPIFLIVAVGEIVLRIATALYGKPSFVHHLYPTHLRLDSLLFGVLLSYLAWSRGPQLASWVRAHRSHLVLASVLCLAPAGFLPPTAWLMETLGFTCLYVGWGAVLLLCLYDERPTAARSDERAEQRRQLSRVAISVWARLRRTLASALAWVGVYSYSIYLWHLAVKRWGVPFAVRTLGWQPGGSAAYIAYLCGSIVMGAAMARLIEIPTLALRDRWFPDAAAARRRPVVVVDPAAA